MRVRGRLPVLWRRAGESQIGTEPGARLVLSGLSLTEHELVEHLAVDLGEACVARSARRCAVSRERAEQLAQTLRSSGLVTEVPLAQRAEEDLFWERVGQDPAARRTRLRAGSVALVGGAPGVRQIGDLLLDAGVGSVLPDDARTTGWLESRRPGCTRAPLGTEPALAVTVEAHVVDPVRARGLEQAGVTQLPVVVSGSGVRVGPLLGGRSPVCATCLGLWEREEDECWPALATQLRLLAAERPDPLLLAQAAAVAARVAVDVLAGSAGGEDALALEVTGASPWPRARRWFPHPECLCSVEGPGQGTGAVAGGGQGRGSSAGEGPGQGTRDGAVDAVEPPTDPRSPLPRHAGPRPRTPAA